MWDGNTWTQSNPQALPHLAKCPFFPQPQWLWLPWPWRSTQCPSPQQRPTCLSGWPLRAQQDTIDCLFTFVEKTLCGHWWGVGEGEVFLLVEFQTRYFSIIAGVALRKQCSFKVSFVFGLNWDITIDIIDRKTQKDRVFNVGQEMAKN